MLSSEERCSNLLLTLQVTGGQEKGNGGERISEAHIFIVREIVLALQTLPGTVTFLGS